MITALADIITNRLESVVEYKKRQENSAVVRFEDVVQVVWLDPGPSLGQVDSVSRSG